MAKQLLSDNLPWMNTKNQEEISKTVAGRYKKKKNKTNPKSR